MSEGNFKEKEKSVTGPRWARLTSRQTGRLTVGHKLTSTSVGPASRKRRQKGNTVSDETAKYGYWSFNDLTSECRHSKLQTHPLVREGALQKELQSNCH
jgi:hypothetical protein